MVKVMRVDVAPLRQFIILAVVVTCILLVALIIGATGFEFSLHK
jgi:nitrate reductase NapE component